MCLADTVTGLPVPVPDRAMSHLRVRHRLPADHIPHCVDLADGATRQTSPRQRLSLGVSSVAPLPHCRQRRMGYRRRHDRRRLVARIAERRFTAVELPSMLGDDRNVSACIDQLAPFVHRHQDVYFIVYYVFVSCLST